MKLIGTALLSALAVGAFAQGQSLTDIWQPNRHIKDQQITLVPWGSGSIAETDEVGNDGPFSIRISTHNYFQGGLIKLSNPMDMSSGYSDPANMLDLTIRTADTVVLGAGSNNGRLGGPGGPTGGGGGTGNPPGFPGGGGRQGGGQGGPPGFPGGGGRQGGGQGGPPGFPGGGGRQGGGQGGPPGGGGRQGGGQGGPPGVPGGGKQGGGGPGAPGFPGSASSKTEPTELQTVRVIIVTTDGKKSEAYLSLPPAIENHPWREVAIPLSKISGFDKTNKVISSIGFSGDTTSTYYIGDMRLVHDTVPITGEMNAKEPLNLALGDTVTLIGYGYGGATILKYSWSFDNTNGVQEDAVGQAVDHKFRKPGKFTVTLTISDYYGLKKPYQVTVPVTVNP